MKKRHEVLDPTPVEWPLGVGVPESLEQKIARMVRTSVSMHAEANGMESFDEADDFDLEEDAMPESVHELDDDQERIARDHAMIRRIPPQFRAAFERELERVRAAEQQNAADPAASKPPSPTTSSQDLRATVSGDTKPEVSGGKD